MDNLILCTHLSKSVFSHKTVLYNHLTKFGCDPQNHRRDASIFVRNTLKTNFLQFAKQVMNKLLKVTGNALKFELLF